MRKNLVFAKLWSILLAGIAGQQIYELATGAITGWGYSAWAAVNVALSFGLLLRAMLAEVLG